MQSKKCRPDFTGCYLFASQPASQTNKKTKQEKNQFNPESFVNPLCGCVCVFACVIVRSPDRDNKNERERRRNAKSPHLGEYFMSASTPFNSLPFSALFFDAVLQLQLQLLLLLQLELKVATCNLLLL